MQVQQVSIVKKLYTGVANRLVCSEERQTYAKWKRKKRDLDAKQPTFPVHDQLRDVLRSFPHFTDVYRSDAETH